MSRPGGCHRVFKLIVNKKNSIECELIDRELNELQSLAGIPKAGGEAAVEIVEELAALIKAGSWFPPCGTICKPGLRFSQKRNSAVLH
jgi:hypothetical protein